MKHIQTFESFLNEAKGQYTAAELSDMLGIVVRSMHFPNKRLMAKSKEGLWDGTYMITYAGDTSYIYASTSYCTIHLGPSDPNLNNLIKSIKNLGGKLRRDLQSDTVSETRKTYTVEDFPVGSIIVYKNGEEWLVVKPGMRRPSDRRGDDQITAKPYNAKAKEGNISMSVDISIDFLNGEDIVNIKQS